METMRWTPPNFDRRHGPPTCLNRYAKHLSGWTDEHGINRCRRCHAALPPKHQRAAYEAYSVDHANQPKWSEARQYRADQRVAKREAAKPKPPRPHDARCRHPPPLTDPMEIHADAQRRMAAGEEQAQCPTCKDWVWKTLFQDPEPENGEPTTDQNAQPCAAAGPASPLRGADEGG